MFSEKDQTDYEKVAKIINRAHFLNPNYLLQERDKIFEP